MIDCCKVVLNGVKDDKELFRKELIKSMKWLSREEQQELAIWLRDNIDNCHFNIIEEVMGVQQKRA